MRAVSIFIALALVGCERRASAPSSAADREAELRRRVATDPRDRQAQRDLGRIFLARGERGAALRHLTLARSARTNGDHAELGRLLTARAQARLANRDVAARQDVADARALGIEVPSELGRAVAFLVAGSQFRRGDARGMSAGRKTIGAAVQRFGADARSALLEPDLSPLAELGKAALWLEAENAKRAALDTLRTYRVRGGRDAQVLLGLERMERWWGTPTRETLGEDLEDSVVIELRDWLEGRQRHWPSQALGEKLAAATVLPTWLSATAHRLRGDLPLARAAVSNARKQFQRWPADQQAIVTIELSLLIPQSETLPPARGELAWLVLARARRAKVPAALRTPFDTSVPERVERIDAEANVDLAAMVSWGDPRAEYALARLQRAAPGFAALIAPAWQPTNAPVGWVAPIGALDPVRLASDLGTPESAAKLAEIAGAIALDGAVADRLATQWIDADIAPQRRTEAVIELFVRAGDPARAARAADGLLQTSPENPRFLFLAAVRAAATKDAARAKVLGSKAAARSGDAGASFRALTGEFAASGAHLEAITVGRRALQLSAARHEGHLRVLIARSMLAIARRASAAELLSHDSVDPRIAHAMTTGILATPSPLGLAWNPADPALLAEQATAPDSTSATQANALARLAAVALYRGTAEDLRRWADVLDATGQGDLAQSARREAAGYRRTAERLN